MIPWLFCKCIGIRIVLIQTQSFLFVCVITFQTLPLALLVYFLLRKVPLLKTKKSLFLFSLCLKSLLPTLAEYLNIFSEATCRFTTQSSWIKSNPTTLIFCFHWKCFHLLNLLLEEIICTSLILTNVQSN